ncbi:MAG: hypothetical protein CMK72_20760 [Pseudomonadaceae bacterium]|uniref:hypothetical protein n=1 Tax=Pseudomonas sp. TaxID=306 RepID=UPI000C0C99BC|nr:hypothetical protein [Pseudomonas sp.]MBQ57312.1 hypothetical protein [Pseudomonadaceae bacterium]
MNFRSLSSKHIVFLIIVAVLFFAWGAWLTKPAAPASALKWLSGWQQQVLDPLAQDQLHLSELAHQVSGDLWLQPRKDGARLLFRGSFEESGQPWAVEGDVQMDAAEMSSLMAAAGLTLQDDEQPLSAQMLAPLGKHRVSAITVLAPKDIAPERLVSSIGQPRLRLELPAGVAWVYPQQGLTAHILDDAVQLIRIVPSKLLQQG